MKLICSSCKKILGVQRPFNNNSEVAAKCPECFQKEKKEALKPQPLPAPGERKDITFENGLKGYITVAGVDSPLLSAWDFNVSGKKIFCAKDYRENFQEYLEMIDKHEVDVTFIYSSSIPLAKTDGRRKRQTVKEEESKTIHYNCTMMVTKDFALSMFDNVAERLQEFIKILAEGVVKAELNDEKSRP